MQVKLGDFRRMIREEQMRGIQEFAVREASRKFVADLRQLLRMHVQMTRHSDHESRDVLEKSEEMLLELENEADKLASEYLWRLLQRL